MWHQKLQHCFVLQEMWFANLRGTHHLYFQTSEVGQGFSIIRFVDSEPFEVSGLLDRIKSDPEVLVTFWQKRIWELLHYSRPTLERPRSLQHSPRYQRDSMAAPVP
jgi:hypothetical protein